MTQDNSELRKRRILVSAGAWEVPHQSAVGRVPPINCSHYDVFFSDSIIDPVSDAADGTFGGKRRPLSIAARGGLTLIVAHKFYLGQGAQDGGRAQPAEGPPVGSVGL